MKNLFVVQLGLFFVLIYTFYPSFSQIKIGVFADCQYCDCETTGSRFYRNSLKKLDYCINEFNIDKNLDFVVGLGDLIDRDFSSYDSVNFILAKSRKEIHHVIGNHDLEVEKTQLEKVPEKLNLTETWYSVTKNGWHFIFLNGNEITFHSNDEKVVYEANKMTEKIEKEGKPNFHDWNGGIGIKQLVWLEKELNDAASKKLKVAVFCHYPLLPLESHALWNSENVLAILTKYDGVKLYMNGHNHVGNYTFQHGIHFVNLKGIVETENENAFSVISFSDDKIEIIGFGREESRILLIE